MIHTILRVRHFTLISEIYGLSPRGSSCSRLTFHSLSSTTCMYMLIGANIRTCIFTLKSDTLHCSFYLMYELRLYVVTQNMFCKGGKH